MGYSTFKILLAVGLCGLALTGTNAEEVADNLTETDEAEFRQGGIAQQLMSSYPSVGGGVYGNMAGYPMMASASGSNGGSYVNMLRNLYRPPNFGLTDKVKHWVKSFMNRRQYVKPYYNPSMSSLSYGVDEYGKPTMMGANSYKAISIPLRQLQKYYKPYYASTDGAASQYVQSASRPGAASANSFMSYSPSSAGASAGSGGLYASESNSAGQFTGSSSGFYGGSSDGSSSLYGTGSGSSLFSPGGSGSSLFASASGPSSGIFSSGGSSGLFSSGGSSGLYSPGGGSSGLYSTGGGSSSMFSPSEGSSSGLFSSAGLAAASSGMYGSGGSPSSGLYQGSSGGSNSGLFSLGGANSGIYSDGSTFYSAGNSGSDYESSAAASSLLTSLNSGSNSAGYGDLFASGASPAASVYNPSSQGSSIRGHGGSNNKKQQQYGASSSALYMPSGSERNADTYQQKSASEPVNSFNVDSTRNSQAEPSYSVSFQPAQGKSFGSSFENSGFQPVSYSSEDGFKSGNVSGFQEKSS